MRLARLAPALLLVSASLLAATPSLNVYFQSTLKDAAYQKKTFDRVAKTWKAPGKSGLPKVGSKTVVQAVIAKDGKLVSTTLSTSSGSKAWDDAAKKAVESAAPYDPLPPGYGYPTLEAHFHVALNP